ncbi:MAG: DUF1080 domain-containing protein [Flavobacteriaceae bacterium]|nr:DUF1080 domain-containing protein [Flavobacteriaceae bacterium]
MRFSSSILVVLTLIFMLIACKKRPVSAEDNHQTPPESWITLFNGVNLDNWIVKINGYPLGENIHNTFRVEDSVLKVSYDGYDKFGESYGHIFYKQPFSNYRLRLQYRFVGEQPADGQAWAKKNSGVMLHSQAPETMGLNQGFPVSLEAQFLGGVEETIERPTGNLCTPGMHVILKDSLVTEHCIMADAPTFYGDEWVSIEVLVLNDSLITHSVNGKEVIRYSKPVIGGEFTPDTEAWKAKENSPVRSGYIALQSESHPIEFKNIKLLEIKD